MTDAFAVSPRFIPDQAPTQSGKIALANGAELWRWDTGGDSPVVILAHPASGNHASWAYQQPVFAAAGYRVIGYSRRGYFGSEIGPMGDLGSQAGDLLGLMDALQVEDAFVIGSAAGGSTVLDFALAFPERVRAAVIASSLMSIQEPDYQAASARARGPWFDGLPVEAREIGPSYRACCPDGVAAWLDIHRLNPSGAPRQPLLSDINWTTLRAMVPPTLLLTGDADLYIPPAALQTVAKHIPQAECVIAPNAGHPIFWEQPDWFNATVLDFFKRKAC